MKKSYLRKELKEDSIDLDFSLCIAMLSVGVFANIMGLVFCIINFDDPLYACLLSLMLMIQVALNCFCLAARKFKILPLIMTFIVCTVFFPFNMVLCKRDLNSSFIFYLFVAPTTYGVSINKRHLLFLPIITLIEYISILYYLDNSLSDCIPKIIAFSICYCFIFCLTNMFSNSARLYYNKAISLSFKDELTGLYNRRKFNEDIQKRNFAYCAMIDIDNFSVCNNTFGHQAGDAILKELAASFLKKSSDEFKIYRYGGEEFFITSRLSFDKTKSNIIKAKKDFYNKTHQTISVGITNAMDFWSVAEIIKKADDNMYFVKENGKNNISSDGATLIEKS